MSRQKCQKDYSLEDEFSQGKIWSFLFPAKVGCQSGFEGYVADNRRYIGYWTLICVARNIWNSWTGLVTATANSTDAKYLG